MIKLRQLTILVMLVFLSTQAFSQMFVLRGGITSSKWKFAESDFQEVMKPSAHPSINVGAAIEFPINDFMFFEVAAYFDGKGTKFNKGTNKEANVHLGYIDVPLRIRVKKDMMLFKVYGSFGPYVGLGVVGEVIPSNGEKRKLDFSTDVKRGDFGLSFGPGVEFNKIFVELAYNLGLANIGLNADKVTNRSISISAGYRFGEEY